MKTEIAKIIDAELNSLTSWNETNTDFIRRVCQIYMDMVHTKKGYTTPSLLKEVLEEVEIEAVEIFRVKTYGHYNLASYRRSRANARQCN